MMLVVEFIGTSLQIQLLQQPLTLSEDSEHAQLTLWPGYILYICLLTSQCTLIRLTQFSLIPAFFPECNNVSFKIILFCFPNSASSLVLSRMFPAWRKYYQHVFIYWSPAYVSPAMCNSFKGWSEVKQLKSYYTDTLLKLNLHWISIENGAPWISTCSAWLLVLILPLSSNYFIRPSCEYAVQCGAFLSWLWQWSMSSPSPGSLVCRWWSHAIWKPPSPFSSHLPSAHCSPVLCYSFCQRFAIHTRFNITNTFFFSYSQTACHAHVNQAGHKGDQEQ